MLSGTVDEVSSLRYPLLASPKLDGIRATVQNGVVLSRNLKPIRNRHVQSLFGNKKYEGLDGELIVGPPGAPDCFLRTSSGVMSAEGEPDVMFYVFDVYGANQAAGFYTRMEYLSGQVEAYSNVSIVGQMQVDNAKELLAYESRILDLGYEGVMLRSLDGLYKQGRSTLKEGWLLKLKVFEYDDAEILEFIEGQTNTNEDVRDALGHAKRSTKQSGMIASGTLGGFRVRGLTGPFKGKEFHVGAGKLSAKDRKGLWDMYVAGGRAVRPGHTLSPISYKYFPRGSKDLPRFPLYHGPATKTEGV